MKSILLSLLLTSLTVQLAYADGYPGTGTTPSAPSEDEGPVAIYLDVKPVCPRRGCWAVTCEAFSRLENVKSVDLNPTPDSWWLVHLQESQLPDPKSWETKFTEYVGSASEFRGVIVQVTGIITEQNDRLRITADGFAPIELTLANRAIQWTKPFQQGEEDLAVQVTGRLTKIEDKFHLDVQGVRLQTP